MFLENVKFNLQSKSIKINERKIQYENNNFEVRISRNRIIITLEFQKKLNRKKETKLIKWQGSNTSNSVRWIVEAESYNELMQKLIEKELIDSVTDLEGFTFQELLNYSKELQILNHNNNIEALYNFDFDKLLESLTSDQIRNIIQANNGMAYYQEFIEE